MHAFRSNVSSPPSLSLSLLSRMASPSPLPSIVLFRSFDSFLSLSLSFALHRSAPHHLPTLSRRFLRIDVIGLFALFRLCLALLSERCIIREVVPIGKKGEGRFLLERCCVITSVLERGNIARGGRGGWILGKKGETVPVGRNFRRVRRRMYRNFKRCIEI